MPVRARLHAMLRCLTQRHAAWQRAHWLDTPQGQRRLARDAGTMHLSVCGDELSEAQIQAVFHDLPDPSVAHERIRELRAKQPAARQRARTRTP